MPLVSHLRTGCQNLSSFYNLNGHNVVYLYMYLYTCTHLCYTCMLSWSLGAHASVLIDRRIERVASPYRLRLFSSRWLKLNLPCCKLHCMILVFICPIAIAYGMGQIIKSVCVCVSVCLCVCPSVGTLTVAFLDRFSQKLAQT